MDFALGWYVGKRGKRIYPKSKKNTPRSAWKAHGQVSIQLTFLGHGLVIEKTPGNYSTPRIAKAIAQI